MKGGGRPEGLQSGPLRGLESAPTVGHGGAEAHSLPKNQDHPMKAHDVPTPTLDALRESAPALAELLEGIGSRVQQISE